MFCSLMFWVIKFIYLCIVWTDIVCCCIRLVYFFMILIDILVWVFKFSNLFLSFLFHHIWVYRDSCNVCKLSIFILDFESWFILMVVSSKYMRNMYSWICPNNLKWYSFFMFSRRDHSSFLVSGTCHMGIFERG